MNSCQKYFSTSLLATAALLAGAFPAWAQDFTVLAGTAVTCTDGNITGDVGTAQAAPTGAVTLTRCVTGTVHVGDGAAIAAYNAFLDRYSDLAPQTGDCDGAHTLLSTIPASMTLAPGVYCTDAALTATGVVLTLDGGGDGNAAWTFKIGTLGTGTLTGTNFSVVMAGGGQACNVNWWVAQAAEMTTSNLKGTLLTGADITVTGGTFIKGDAFAGGVGSITVPAGAVTLTGATVVGCDAQPGPGPVPGPGPRACSDKVTGGGYITVNKKNANFGVTGGISRKGKPRGHLTYIDHGTGLKVKGTGVTAYEVVDATTRFIRGTAKINGQRGFTYTVLVSDNGEPGKNKDKFAISLFDASGKLVYSASGTLAGGNIQIHKRHCGQANDNDDDDDDDGDDDGDDQGDEKKKQSKK